MAMPRGQLAAVTSLMVTFMPFSFRLSRMMVMNCRPKPKGMVM